MMATRSQSVSASERMWVEKNTVLPSRLSCSIRSRTSRRPMGSSPDMGSSKNTSLGSCRIAWPIPTRCSMPLKNLRNCTPRDVFTGDRQVLLDWRKTRWHCGTPGCEQGTFTEWLPAVKRRARLTSRLRTCLGEAVGDDLTAAAAAARRYGVSDRTAARAFTAYADEQLAGLDERQGPVEAAGVDEFRRGAPADRTDPETGEVTRTRSEWLTHLVDLDGGGTLGLAEGRTAAAEKDLLTGHAATLRYLAMDMSATYRSGAPAGVTLVADAFHLVKLANRKIDDAFRRLGYRTQHAHEELGLPRPLHYMLRYNIENLDPGHLATI